MNIAEENNKPSDNVIVKSNDKTTPSIKVKSLLDKTMLVSLNISCFGGVMKDKAESKKIQSDHQTKKGGGNVIKKILHGKPLDGLKNQAQKIRNIYKAETLQWGEADRIIKIENYTTLKMKLEEEIRVYNEMADKIKDQLTSLQYEDSLPAPRGLGSLYNESDYPSPDNFRASFSAEINIRQVATDDFRSGFLSESEIIRINEQIQKHTDRVLKEAHKNNLSRVHDTLNHLITRLVTLIKNPEGGRFHASSVSNITDSIAIARGLNISDDPKVEATLKDVEDKVKMLSAESIRDDVYAQIAAMDTAKQAVQNITDAMKDFDF